MTTHRFDLATGRLVCTNCEQSRRMNGSWIGVGALIQTAQAFLVEHAGCQPGDVVQATLDRAFRGLAETLGGKT